MKIVVQSRVHFVQEHTEITFGSSYLFEPSRRLTADRGGPVQCLDALPFGEPEISSEVNPLTSAALENHPDIARGNTVIWVGRVDRVFASDVRLASAAAIRTVAHDDLRFTRWHLVSIAGRPIPCNSDDGPIRRQRATRVSASICGGVLSDIDHGDGKHLHGRVVPVPDRYHGRANTNSVLLPVDVVSSGVIRRKLAPCVIPPAGMATYWRPLTL